MTNISNPSPYSTSFYAVQETNNTSCRFLRSTFNYVPTTQSLLSSTNLLFAITLQPFAEVPSYEAEIPKVKAEENIFRCKQCKSYINSKYNITYSKTNKHVAICNICNFENDFDITKPGMKNEYFNADFSSVPELTSPTVDFIAPSSFNTDTREFQPHYLFMIDTSVTSLELGLPSYVLNSIQLNLDAFHNKERTHISIAFYDQKNIYFYYIEKGEVKMVIVPDINDPFCPIGADKLYLNITTQRDEVDKLLEKLNIVLTEKTQNISGSKVHTLSTPSGSAMKAGVDSLCGYGGRVLVFTPNTCTHGFGACVPRDKINKDKEPEKTNVFYPQHDKFAGVIETAVNNRTVVDQFIFMNTNYDLSTLSTVSTQTGGHVEYYPPTTNQTQLNSLFEKLHYDLTRIVTRPNYYDVKFMIRFSIGIDCFEILGPFTKKLGEAFQLGGCDPDYLFMYNFRFSESFKPQQKINFQIVCLFNDNYGQRYLRTFNTTIEATDEVGKLFTTADVDAMTKSIIMKEISLTYRSDFMKVRTNLEERIINSFKFYRVRERSSTPSSQLILPVSLRYLPLYLNSFIKKGILSKNNTNYPANQLIACMNKLMRDPLSKTIKYLYPQFYRIDNITTRDAFIGTMNEQYKIIRKPEMLPLSKDNIDFDCAYMIDNGEYINVFVFDQIDETFYNDMFGVHSWDEAVQQELTTLNEEIESELNTKVFNIIMQLRYENAGHYQPICVHFLNESSIAKKELAQLLIEDKVNDEVNYSQFLCMIHDQIQRSISY